MAMEDERGQDGAPPVTGPRCFIDEALRCTAGKTGYDYPLLVRRIHVSRFPDEASGEKVSTASTLQRRVPLAPLPGSITGEYCTDLALERPTLDIPENAERLRQLLADAG